MAQWSAQPFNSATQPFIPSWSTDE